MASCMSSEQHFGNKEKCEALTKSSFEGGGVPLISQNIKKMFTLIELKALSENIPTLVLDS